MENYVHLNSTISDEVLRQDFISYIEKLDERYINDTPRKKTIPKKHSALEALNTLVDMWE